MPAPYTKLGSYPIVPAAEIISLTSTLNAARGSNVVAQNGAIGKVPGAIIVRATTVGDPTTYSLVMASGPLPADRWFVLDGSASYLPV